jgi:hypothetical protein
MEVPLKTATLLALASAGALAAPAPAQASSISVQGACVVSGRPVTVAGSGFTPNDSVTISGGAAGTAATNAAGTFTTQITAPDVTTIAPKMVTIDAREAANPANLGTATFPVVKDVFVSNVPISGRPSQQTTWRFAGFQPGKAIYGHFRLKGRTRRNYRFGPARGACGTLVVRARRVPVRKVLAGTWTLQLDQSRSYSPKTPHRSFRFRIYRTFKP